MTRIGSVEILFFMILIPLLGAIINGLFLRTRHTRRAGMLATACAGLSFACAVILFLAIDKTEVIRFSTEWMVVGTTVINWGFAFDNLTAFMCLIITGIGTLIHLYSIGYMSEEPTPSRYFAYLNLFLTAMLTLVTGSNLVVLFVGWEGVGLCSYLLIGYWHQDIAKANAGIKAFVVNRIGDAAFLIGIFMCLYLFGTVEFSELALRIDGFDPRMINLIALFFFIGATGKSAQLPLYVWLPDAMAGPTPVSALIHAATMVTAGVYLISRMSFLFVSASITNQTIALVGALTALFAATIAVAQKDIKKVLAYSTVSQLGLMFLALGTLNYFGALFHVMTHAFFKALMFLGAGSVIHGLHGEQDITHMGGLAKKLPITHFTFLLGTIAICGIPPLAGFFSKDAILYGALMDGTRPFTLWGIGSLASLLTAFYMTRLYCLTFLGEYRGHAHPHESPSVMTIPLIVLAVGSVVAGWVGMPHAFHLLHNYLGDFLSGPVVPWKEEGAKLGEWTAMAIASVNAFIGVGAGFYFYGKNPNRSAALALKLTAIRTILFNKYWIDELYDLLFVTPFEKVSRFLSRVFDVRIVDGLVLLPGRFARAGGVVLSFVQNGVAQFYLLVMLLGTLAILWVTLRGVII